MVEEESYPTSMSLTNKSKFSMTDIRGTVDYHGEDSHGNDSGIVAQVPVQLTGAIAPGASMVFSEQQHTLSGAAIQLPKAPSSVTFSVTSVTVGLEGSIRRRSWGRRRRGSRGRRRRGAVAGPEACMSCQRKESGVMENGVILVWSKAALLGVCGLTAAMREAPSRSGPPAGTGAIELKAQGIDVGSASPAYTETNCSCSQFTCGGLGGFRRGARCAVARSMPSAVRVVQRPAIRN